MTAFGHILNVEDARRAARRRLPFGLFEYIDRGTEDEVAIAGNRAGLDAIKLAPSVLIDITQRSPEAEIFGIVQPSPLIIAPTAVAGLVWHDGEIALATAAAQAGIPFCVSTQSITPIERIADESGARLWFQLYVWKSRERTLALIDRAAKAGAEALVLTVDTAVGPVREYNIRNGFGIPLKPSLRAGIDLVLHPRWTLDVMLRAILASGVPTYAHYPDEFRTKLGRTALSTEVDLAPDVTWDDVRLLRRRWKGKLILKGILTVEDARTALDHGVDGIVVSNHGARNLDCAPGPTDVLPAIVAAVGDKIEILADSGVRRGADIARFIALGAKGVMIGRATLYGVAIGGAPGASRVLDLLHQQLSATMGMLGARRLSDIRLA
ncbi:alpha-hydroxy-acid oxidizing enzyme [Pseudolabrys sp. Root1462]|uniref:alpha-hydroxy acid oxidase n=1 Tax=Pseudolabrys sp. Root1462 TaxID=1736466 RepID=UPI0007033D91|nr:alpha-hydroxy acid oxidase [Pseudolabrys sp. Root1462]KQY99620.1 alpha-hydroxy-acid oxidizing enzyme [Pseudolabrys sp. Root1462]